MNRYCVFALDLESMFPAEMLKRLLQQNRPNPDLARCPQLAPLSDHERTSSATPRLASRNRNEKLVPAKRPEIDVVAIVRTQPRANRPRGSLQTFEVKKFRSQPEEKIWCSLCILGALLREERGIRGENWSSCRYNGEACGGRITKQTLALIALMHRSYHRRWT